MRIVDVPSVPGRQGPSGPAAPRRARRLGLLAGAALLLLSFAPFVADAQYPGDVYFAQSSVALGAGATADLPIQLYAGASPVGGARFVVRYDPAEILLEGAEPVPGAPLSHVSAAAISPGRFGVAVTNGVSSTAPIGSVDLARIRVRAVAPAGTTATLTIESVELLTTSKAPFAVARGFACQVVITSAPMTANAAVRALTLDPATDPSPAETAAALAARPAGHVVRIFRLLPLGGGFGAVPVEVPTRDPAAASD